MSLFDLQDVCIVIGSLATLDIPMVVDLIGIYVLKGPYCTLTMSNWFLQALSVIPRGSWGDVARCFTMIRWLGLLHDHQSNHDNLKHIHRQTTPAPERHGVKPQYGEQLKTAASSKHPKAVSNEASQQEESNATTLTSIETVYHRQSKKIRSHRNLKNKADIPARIQISQQISLYAQNRSLLTRMTSHKSDIATGHNGDRPAEAPLCLAWLPEEPAKANQDPSSPNTGKENEVKPQYEEHNKATVISDIQYFKRAMHEGYHESSVRRLNRPSPVVFRHDDSAGHHNSNVRPFRHEDSAGRSQRTKGFSSQGNQDQYVYVNAQQTHA
ncbi:plasminogen activator inhibitor 1 RNA-binding protein-like [Dorcoceras hygrometricum]|uniref:Plasminogen activator inhibitor 1 RNA-binding protein-like n=1 Tax=Dorcoceras hygrometricum TaxID=472368 RepID=A0A2Z7BLH9_9LAMI|nr:plasminogen activator inhibitor 1 RNA-binding protein-like [Dorcoceras hygrometricum]